MILGHGHPAVLDAVQRAAADGFSFGAPTEREVELAETIVELVPSVEQVRLVSSGTEAAMSAIRLARGVTGRSLIVKFEGCYHGHADALLVKAGSGLATFGHPTSAGVPAEVVQHTLVLEYNDVDQLEAAFAQHGAQHRLRDDRADRRQHELRSRRACRSSQRLRELCTRHGALLVFDEVMTGFRVALGGAQSLYAQSIPGFEPDICVFGKVIGGGMPLAAFGGKREVMEQLAPLGPVYQAGTLSGNPVATACGLSTLHEMSKPGFFEGLSRLTRALVDGLAGVARDAGVPLAADCEGGMFGFFFSEELPRRTTLKSWRPTRRASTASSTPCSIVACTSRRHSTKPASSVPRTATATLPRRSTLPLPRCAATTDAPWLRPGAEPTPASARTRSNVVSFWNRLMAGADRLHRDARLVRRRRRSRPLSIGTTRSPMRWPSALRSTPPSYACTR